MGDRSLHDNQLRTKELLERPWRMLVGGELVASQNGTTFETANPATGEPLAVVPFAGASDVDRAVTCAETAFPAWRNVPVVERSRLVHELVARLQASAADLGLLDAVDSGNPVTAMVRDVELSAALSTYMAGAALEVKGTTVPASAEHLHLTIREPYGVVGRIIAYNHPILFASHKIVPPLLMGNTVVLKAPEQAPLAPLLLGELIREVFPPGVVNIVTGDGPTTGDALVRHPRVKRIALIGGVDTGMRIQHAAAEVAVKRVSLELGGKNAMIVLPDADLDAAVTGAVAGMNFSWSQGQSCGSTSRLFLHDSIHDAFVERLVDRVGQLRIGDPLDPDTEMGCLISPEHHDRVMGYVASGLEEGAHLATGGRPPAGEIFARGCFLAPTVFTGVTDGMRIAREEIFGPVLCVLRWHDVDEVVRRANGLQFGLTAAIWTRDVDAALRMARAVDAGYVWINGSSRHFPGVPFGGHRNSGTDSEESIDELLSFTEQKSINVVLSR
ncbi:MAG: aldehyde dehydrogenase family protein [Actinomycetota bacterium]